MVDLIPQRYKPKDRNLFADMFSDLLSKSDPAFKTDIKETADSHIIEAEIPGVNKENINLEIRDNHLNISVTFREINKEENENYIRKERRTGNIQRSFYLPDIKKNRIQAHYNNGLLRVILPKANPEVKAKSIEIN